MKRNRFFAALAALSICLSASADEGMWMVNAISRALALKMEQGGLEMKPGEIYNENEVALCDAIVSLDFACSGSMVSDRGLLITNHHCAYSDVFNLSTKEHNYLEDGFWAHGDADEIPIPGKSVFFLKRVLDVTEEANALIEKEKLAGKKMGSRKLSYVLEKKYSKETGLEASLSSMWAGSRYYLALYKVYTDIRLVAAPPVSIAAFGGDVDNWEWPQHKCDFAMYRIYAAPDGSPAEYSEKNVALKPERTLKISTDGLNHGDYTMVIGYPGRTDRYTSSAKLRYDIDVNLPILNEVRGAKMEIISKWMNADPEIRLKYADKFFSLSNVQELFVGQLDCYRKYGVYAEKKKQDREIRSAEGRQTIKELDTKYKKIAKVEKDRLYFRETIIRSTELSLIATKMKNIKSKFDPEEAYASIDMRVEKDLFDMSVQKFYENVDSTMWGPVQKKYFTRFTAGGNTDFKGLSSALWKDGMMTREDDIFKFFTESSIRDYNVAVDSIQKEPGVSTLGRAYTRELFRAREAKGKLQYPDANSTMRLTFGKVSSFHRNGCWMPETTRSYEILAKEDTTAHDFTLKPEWRELLKNEVNFPVNFICDCDITGGNSGSPVLNGKGELVGLAFDGNKESLAGNASFTPEFNKCICVDIRYVLWTLKNYGKMDRLLEEMNQR